MQKCRHGNRRVFRHCWDTEALKRPCGHELLISCRLCRRWITHRAARAETREQLCFPDVRLLSQPRLLRCCEHNSVSTAMLLSSRRRSGRFKFILSVSKRQPQTCRAVIQMEVKKEVTRFHNKSTKPLSQHLWELKPDVDSCLFG